MQLQESVRCLLSMQIRQKHKKAEKLACDLAEVFADEITSFEPDFSCEIAVTEGQSAMAVQEEDAKAFVSLMRLAPKREFTDETSR